MKQPDHRRFHPLLLLAALFCNSALASEKLDIQHYPVSAPDLPALRTALDAQGPLGGDGQRFHGVTRWQVEWSFDYDQRRNRCAIKRIDTRVKAQMILPEWTDSTLASAADQQAWQRYQQALREHEDGHYGMATAAAQAIKQQLATLSAATCTALGNQFNARASALIEDYQRREIAYDLDTGHGASQGARL